MKTNNRKYKYTKQMSRPLQIIKTSLKYIFRPKGRFLVDWIDYWERVLKEARIKQVRRHSVLTFPALPLPPSLLPNNHGLVIAATGELAIWCDAEGTNPVSVTRKSGEACPRR